jgi:hypothetical protein
MLRRGFPRWFIAPVAMSAVVLSGVGCGEAKQAPPRTMAISDVPPAFMETARRELPDVAFDEVWVKKNGTLEIRGKGKNGKVREVEIRPDGTVEEIE